MPPQRALDPKAKTATLEYKRFLVPFFVPLFSGAVCGCALVFGIEEAYKSYLYYCTHVSLLCIIDYVELQR